MVDHTKMPTVSAWRPTTNLVELAVLGKALEEAGELVEALCGENGKDITDEVADNLAMISLIHNYYDPDWEISNEAKAFYLSNAMQNSDLLDVQITLGRYISALSRVLIQGIEEASPETGRPNKDLILSATREFLKYLTGFATKQKLDMRYIAERVYVKYEHKKRWHEILIEMEAGGPARDVEGNA